MAEVIWGLATSHVPSIGAAMDRGKTEDPNWKGLFDGYAPAREWLAEHRPDVAIVVYNDHANGIDLDIVPTFGIGTAERYEVADEGFGKRPVPDVVGDPELSLHLLESLVDDGFDLTVFQELDVDHGFTVPLSVWTPDPGEAWPCPVIPLLVNVIQYPQPTAARCYALGQALGPGLILLFGGSQPIPARRGNCWTRSPHGWGRSTCATPMRPSSCRSAGAGTPTSSRSWSGSCTPGWPPTRASTPVCRAPAYYQRVDVPRVLKWVRSFP